LEWENIKEGLLSSTPTYIRCELTFNLDDYGEKGGRTPRLIGSRVYWRSDGAARSASVFLSNSLAGDEDGLPQ
jgi:hypothetical protein